MNHANPNRLADSETLIQCPYDQTHMVRVKRWQPHIIKCRRNNPNMELKCCPFNAKHELPAVEMPHHLTICQDQVTIHDEIVHRILNGSNDDALKGNTRVPEVTNWAPTAVAEDWTEEYCGNPVRVDVLGTQQSVTGVDRSSLTPAQRREHRKLLKQMVDAAKAGKPTDDIKAAIRALGRFRYCTENIPDDTQTTSVLPRMPHGPPQVDLMYKRMNGVAKTDAVPKNRLAANFNNLNRPGRDDDHVPISRTQSGDVNRRVEMLTQLAAGRGRARSEVNRMP